MAATARSRPRPRRDAIPSAHGGVPEKEDRAFTALSAELKDAQAANKQRAQMADAVAKAQKEFTAISDEMIALNQQIEELQAKVTVKSKSAGREG